MEKNQINRNYRYDSLNRLVSVESEENTVSYTWDASGNRTLTTCGISPAMPSSVPETPVTAPESVPAPSTGGQVCPHCGQAVGAASKFCRACGSPLPKTPAVQSGGICSRCGTVLGQRAKFCPKCGERAKR